MKKVLDKPLGLLYALFMPNKRKLKQVNFLKDYKNRAEQAFATAAREEGWLVTKRGYPDFICYRGEELMLVEVKCRNGRLKSDQLLLMNSLGKRGIKCYKWSPERNFFNKNNA